MTNYELTYIISNQYTEKEIEVIKKKVDDILKKYQATIGYQYSLGKKKLAYPINKIATGYYLVTEFELEEKDNIEKINDSLRLDKEVVRSIIISKPKISQKEINHIEKKNDNTETEELKTKLSKPIFIKEKEIKEETIEIKPENKKSAPKVSINELNEKIDKILQDDNIL